MSKVTYTITGPGVLQAKAKEVLNSPEAQHQIAELRRLIDEGKIKIETTCKSQKNKV